MVHKGMVSKSGVKLITVIKAYMFLGRGCEGFLCNVVETEAAEPSLLDNLVVWESPDVFPKDIYGMPSLR